MFQGAQGIRQQDGKTTARCRAEQDPGCLCCLAAKDRSQLNRHRSRAALQLLVFCPSPPTPQPDPAPAAGLEGQETDPLPTVQAAALAGTCCHLPTPPPTGASQLGRRRIQTWHNRSSPPGTSQLLRSRREPAQPSRGAGSAAGSLCPAQPCPPCPQAALLLSARKGRTCNADVGDLRKPTLRSLGRASAPFSLRRGSSSRWKRLPGRIFNPTPFLPLGELCQQRGDTAADPMQERGNAGVGLPSPQAHALLAAAPSACLVPAP